MDLDLWISKVKEGQHLAEHELQTLCEYVKEILIEESNVQPVNSPVTVSLGIGSCTIYFLKASAYDPLDPSGNITVSWDFLDIKDTYSRGANVVRQEFGQKQFFHSGISG
ncbi:phytochrome-associated serine/threonine-protein phosphatase [Hordeum vulgare]|nr:phytochrome-associated serine/threonine-protein phosphatase [Hordeum vulgare]